MCFFVGESSCIEVDTVGVELWLELLVHKLVFTVSSASCIS